MLLPALCRFCRKTRKTLQPTKFSLLFVVLALITGLFFSFCTMSQVSATAKPKDATFIVTDNSDFITDTGSLRYAITAANTAGGGNINFAISNVTITLASTLPTISTPITITGPGASQLTISGNNAYQIFVVDNASNNCTISTCQLNMSGLTIANGAAISSDINGGGLENKGGSVTLTNMVFTNNHAGNAASNNGAIGGSGGAINSVGGSLVVSNSTFTSNSSGKGSDWVTGCCAATGGSGGNGGAINSSGVANINNSNFFSNTTGNGGVGEYGGDSEVDVGGNGGNGGNGAAISNSGILTITDSTFTANVTGIGGDGGFGFFGGYAGAGGYGGAVNNYGTLTVINSTFTSNSTSTGGNAGSGSPGVDGGSGGGGNGGAFSNLSGSVVISNSTFVNNRAGNGADYSGGNGGNAGLGGSGGAIFFYNGTANLINSTVVSNYAGLVGIGDNSGVPDGVGGGVAVGVVPSTPGQFNIGSSIVASNSGNDVYKGSFGTTTSQNYNVIGDGTKSGLTAQSGDKIGKVNVSGAINPMLKPLANNVGATATVALLAGSPAIGIVATNCPATDQRGMTRPATNCDAGAFQTGTVGNGTNPSLCTEPALNVALQAAGYIYIYCPPNTTITVTAQPDTNSNFRSITSTVGLDASPSLSFTLSGADSYQVFNVNSGANFTLNALTIAHGIAPSDNCATGVSCGGGIYNSGTLTVTNSTFISNTCTVPVYYDSGEGGAIYNIGNISRIASTTFIFNFVPYGIGGAIANSGNISSISNTTFTSNSAHGGGGAIYSDGVISNIINSTFISNSTALGYGGVIFFDQGAVSSISNSSFISNSSPQGHGAIVSQGGNIFISNNVFAKPSNGINCTNFGGVTDGGGNLSDDSSCAFSQASSRNNVTNLNLGTLGYYNGGSTQTVPLLAGSAALFAGVSANCPTTDQNNQPRPQPNATSCDAGAFESNLQLASTVSAGSTPNPSQLGVSVTLTATVSGNNVFTPTGSVAFTNTTTNTSLGSATLDSNGNATLPNITFNNAGSFNIAVGYSGNFTFTTATTAFTQTVIGSTTQPPTIAVFAGNGQSTPISTTFPVPLQVVVRDGSTNNLLPNTTVVFQVPTSGASGTFSPTNSIVFTATTDANGVATANALTANGVVGSYQVTASTAGAASPAIFDLINSPARTTTGYTYYLPFLANNANNFSTYLVFQNTANISNTVAISFFDNNGNAVAAANNTCTSVAALGECIVPNPFASGKQGEGIIISQQPLNVIVSEATPYGGSAYAVSAGASNNLVAPVAIKGGLGDFTTQLSIFNGGNSSVTGTIQFFDQNGNHVAVADKTFNLAAHSTTIYDQSQDNMLTNFYGWAEITSPAGSELVAQTLEQRPSVKFVAIVNAQLNPQTTLYAPAIFNSAFGNFVTGANLVNPNNQPVTVTITYYKNDGTATTTAPFTITANSVVGIFHGATSGNGLPQGGLPSNWYGAATIKVVGGSGIIMFVNEQGGVTATGSDQSGTYGAAVSGSSTVGLPVLANGAFGGYITGATIENITNSPVTATVQYYDLDGNAVGTAKTVTIGGNASAALYQGGSDQALSSGFYGTAQITVIGGPSSSLLVTTNAQSNAFFYSYTEPNF